MCAELAEQASESMGTYPLIAPLIVLLSGELFVPTEVTDPNGAVNGGNGGKREREEGESSVIFRRSRFIPQGNILWCRDDSSRGRSY